MNSAAAQLSDWGLPPLIVAWFRKKGITNLFKWQEECLCQGDVLSGGNLVYSAPTSAGKTLVADFLLLKRVLESSKKALVIEPFIALTREKATTLKSMMFTTKARVGTFAGAYYTPGGMSAVSVAVCTIEKANNFINKLINENKLSELGIIVVDEIHYLGDERRGHQLELILTKILYHNSKREPSQRIQIVGLSATVPNLKSIADWLKASVYITDYRPVPLIEKVKVDDRIYEVRKYLDNQNSQPLEVLDPSKFAIEKDHDGLFCICLDTIINGYSTLVFCESKRECEIMAIGLADQIKLSDKKLKSGTASEVSISDCLRRHLSVPKIIDILQKLKKCPAGPDTELVKALRMGVAFHHAGLTSEEREIVEDGFKSGAIKVLMATSTLSSGVNLPARKVVIRGPMMISGNSSAFQREMLNPSTYRQMIGRAGRKNIDTCGESILITRPDNKDIAFELLKSSLGNIRSSLGCRLLAAEGEPSGLKKAVLEVIANETAVTGANLNNYLNSTFWLSSESHEDEQEIKRAIVKTIRFLISNKFIEELTPNTFKATRLGNAVLNSGLHPDESLELVNDLMKARKEFCLLNDLHIIYQVTPNDIARTVELRDWQHYSKVWYELDDICQYVGVRVGINEVVIARRAQGFSKTLSEENERVYRRFWVALVVNDLVREIQLSDICVKYRMRKATVQQVQRAVAQYAGVMSIFCNELGYANIAALLTPLESRINFSCQRDLLDLVRLNITRPIARALYNAGYKYILNVAKGDKLEIEFVIRQLQPFKKEQSFSETDSPIMWVPELARNMTTLDYASHIVDTARSIVEIELDIDLTTQVDRKRENDQSQSSQLSLEPSPAKRGRSEDDSNQILENVEESRGEPAEEMVRGVPNFVIRYVGRNMREVESYLDKWIKHTDISLNFKVEQQINEPIGGKFKANRRQPKRRRRRSEDIPLCAGTSNEDELTESIDEEFPSSQHLPQDGLPLRLDIDQKKHSVTKMYTCFEDDLTVHIIDSSQVLLMVRDKLPARIAQMASSSSSTGSKPEHLKKLYTQNIVLTYKVLYTAFNIDQTTLNKSFEWHSFDVAWWMISNCPNRGMNNINSSLSLVANTKWASRYHHFLHPSSPKKKGKKSKLIPPLSDHDLGRSLIEFNRLKDVVKSGKTAILRPLIDEILDELEDRNQIVAYRDAEIPSRLTMAQMMIHGIGLDIKQMRDELTLYEDILQQLSDVAQKHYAKSSISLTNIKHVARILYEDLDLKKHLLDYNTNSDISKDPTNSEVLKILGQYHPFPKLVQDFRKIGKALEALQSVGTYARHSSELNMMRIFGQCDFWQLTGRVSMFDPDLFLINRNFSVTIPAHGQRAEEQVECAPRRCFIPVPGWTFIAADYSQLELRLLAHFSEEHSLLEILNRNPESDKSFDVFKTVAARIHQKPPEEISKDDRQHAKQICYGIIYGMGNRSLANQLGVDVERAELFRKDFFEAFPRIGEFTDQLIEDCEKKGYVESLLGRRRTIVGINSENSSVKARAKRVAINTRIQSSASDIIKVAMSVVNEKILSHFSSTARLTLEMHDELIYEVSPDVVDQFSKVLKSSMESFSSRENLRVSLLVNLKRGLNWSNLEDFIPI